MNPVRPIELDPVIEAFKKDVDVTLLRRNLALGFEERLRNLIELQRFAKELRRAGREARKKLTRTGELRSG